MLARLTRIPGLLGINAEEIVKKLNKSTRIIERRRTQSDDPADMAMSARGRAVEEAAQVKIEVCRRMAEKNEKELTSSKLEPFRIDIKRDHSQSLCQHLVHNNRCVVEDVYILNRHRRYFRDHNPSKGVRNRRIDSDEVK